MPNCFGDKPPTADEANACQDTGDHMVRALHEYQQARFGSVHADYLKIFGDRLKNALQSHDCHHCLLRKLK